VMLKAVTSVTKARFDLAALFAIWVGTALITLVGVPSVLGPLLLGQDGSRLLGEDGALLTGAPDPADVALYWRYMTYAIPGMILITLGMLWQGIEPAKLAFSSKSATPS
jgi:hypothetical protein